MTPGLLVLSPDADMVEQICCRFSSRYDVRAATSPQKAGSEVDPSQVQAVLAHLGKGTLEGHSAEKFLAELQEAALQAPIFGLVEKDCPAKFRRLAATVLREILSVPVDFAQLEQLLADQTGMGAEVMSSFAGLPYRSLQGQTRSLITFTPSMFEVLDELKVAAAHDVTMLLIGETGSGKTFLARLIHELSGRRDQRCLTVACGALPPDLIESELFGYVKGAFTGADGDKPGKFAAAGHGTLLLDEIDVLTPEQQAKLLRVIETGEYEPVGSNETRVSNTRLIAASNVDLQQLVQENKFRMDLYYRLNTLSFHLPPLRQRPWDIEFLARKFAVQQGRGHNIHIKHIEPEFLAALRQYPWPGNIRELENVLRRAVLYCRDGVLATADLPSSMRPAVDPQVPSRTAHAAPQASTLEDRVAEVECRIIAESLQRNGHHRTQTAKELGISRVTLYNKMKKYGLLSENHVA